MPQREDEFRRKWDEYVALEKQLPGAQEDKAAFFAWKKKESAKLKAELDKIRGFSVNPHDQALNQRLAFEKTKQDILKTEQGRLLKREDL